MNDVIKMVLWDGQREDESNGERERGRRQTNWKDLDALGVKFQN